MYGKYRKGNLSYYGRHVKGIMGLPCILEERPKRCLQTSDEETVEKKVNW
jgi:hypothetical protein